MRVHGWVGTIEQIGEKSRRERAEAKAALKAFLDNWNGHPPPPLDQEEGFHLLELTYADGKPRQHALKYRPGKHSHWCTDGISTILVYNAEDIAKFGKYIGKLNLDPIQNHL